MAIHRTKIQKQQAAQKRKLQYAYTSAEALVASAHSTRQPTATTKPHAQPQIEKPLESGLARHIQLTSAYLSQDLRKTLIVSIVLFVLLIGIWWATRYNGMSTLF